MYELNITTGDIRILEIPKFGMAQNLLETINLEGKKKMATS